MISNTNLKKIISEVVSEKQEEDFKEFAKKRLDGATKITENAKKKGGPALLTYYHFVVKLPYYKKAANGDFDLKETKKELSSLMKKVCSLGQNVEITQNEFQKLVGKIEVLGELIIKYKK